VNILQMVLETSPEVHVSFFTSRKHQVGNVNYSDIYSREWHKSFDQDPPDTQVVIAGIRPGGDSPIHDRWWITKDAGLRIGTSFNGLGLAKDTELSSMRRDEVAECEVQLDSYLHGSVRSHNGQKIDLVSFPLL
jgi:hypothetical protein